MALTFNLPSQIVVQTAAQWAVDATVYSNKRILVISDAYYGSTDQRKFKIADGTQTWAQLDYMPISQTLAQVLANGSSTNAVSFKSPDSLTELLVANNNIDAYVDDTSNVSEINITPNTIVISTTGASIDLSATSVTKNSSEILTSSNITQVITNGVTDKAPSEDAVYDALATKRSSTYETLVFTGSFSSVNFADSTTYYFGTLPSLPPQTIATVCRFGFNKDLTITKALLICSQGVNYSNEAVSVYLREDNTTDSTITTSLNLNSVGLNAAKIFTYPLSIPVLAASYYEVKLVMPAFATNGNFSRWTIQLYGY